MSYLGRKQSPSLGVQEQPGRCCSQPTLHVWECCCDQFLSVHQSHKGKVCNLERVDNKREERVKICLIAYCS